MTHNQYGGVVYSWKFLRCRAHFLCGEEIATTGKRLPVFDDRCQQHVFGVTIGGQGSKTNGTLFEFAG